MRLLIAMMKHETNTFSPVPTPLARFGNGPGPLYGEAAIRAYRGTGSGLGAYLDLAEREGAEIVLPIAAGAPPSRPVEDTAFEHIAGIICDAVRKGGFDGIMLDLHGAMVTESLEDGEGELLRRIRAIDPDTPIAVSLDMHANLYDAIIENATVVTGYHTYPHIDTYDTARRAGEILLQAMRGEVRPVMAWGNVPMLPHVMRQGTDDHPNKELQAPLRRDERRWRVGREPVHRLSARRHHQCRVSARSRHRRRPALAEELRDELLDRAWADREDFVYQLEPLDQSLARAKSLEPPKPGEGRSCCSTITTIAPRAARWTRPPCSPRSCARASKMSPRSRSMTRRPCSRLSRPASALRSRFDRRQDGDAGDPRRKPPARRDRHGQDHLERALPQQGADGARRADGHGAERRARHRTRRDRADLSPCRA